MSNVSAWMRCKADLVHGWTIQPFTFISIVDLKKQRDRGAPWESRGRSAAAALWLLSPTRQRVKLKTTVKQFLRLLIAQNNLASQRMFCTDALTSQQPLWQTGF